LGDLTRKKCEPQKGRNAEGKYNSRFYKNRRRDFLLPTGDGETKEAGPETFRRYYSLIDGREKSTSASFESRQREGRVLA